MADAGSGMCWTTALKTNRAALAARLKERDSKHASLVNMQLQWTVFKARAACPAPEVNLVIVRCRGECPTKQRPTKRFLRAVATRRIQLMRWVHTARTG